MAIVQLDLESRAGQCFFDYAFELDQFFIVFFHMNILKRTNKKIDGDHSEDNETASGIEINPSSCFTADIPSIRKICMFSNIFIHTNRIFNYCQAQSLFYRHKSAFFRSEKTANKKSRYDQYRNMRLNKPLNHPHSCRLQHSSSQ